MNTNKKVLTRNVTKEECPWLEEDINKGSVVFIYNGPTYGCVSSGVAVSVVEGKTPFFELPTDALGDTIVDPISEDEELQEECFTGIAAAVLGIPFVQVR